MKAKQQIDVWVSPEGAITIDAVGYTGNNCEEATAFLEQELGSIGRRQRTDRVRVADAIRPRRVIPPGPRP